ncbi:ATP-binding cassette sub-family C member 9-like [Diadema antillarum]|uniref:ATP-binding cassette sub-family C member 9-like n=1 Tax=Diadema antillarum TaxID=105358 RepID=UPI003A8976A6
MSEKGNWFCGVNYTTQGDARNSTCLINGIIAAPQLGFCLLAPVVLILVRCCCQRSDSIYLLRLPGHTPRWLFSYVYVILALAYMAEGILTDEICRASSFPLQPHLFVPGVVMVVAALLSILYYHMMERWRSRNMVWLLLVYWLLSLASMALGISHLAQRGDADWHIFNFDVTLALLFVVTLMCVIEFVICHCWGDPDNLENFEDTKKPDMRYLNDYSNLLSSLTFWWMNWLFALGYKKTVVPSDLGSIPEIHTSKYNHEIFKKNFMQEKERARLKGVDINLYRVYWKTYWRRLLMGGFLKFCADCLSLVGPLCISGIVLYVETKMQDSDAAPTTPPRHVTIEEFFQNGLVLVGCIYIAAITRHTFDQAYFYVGAVEGVHVKSALQSMVYEKSLRLSTFAMSGGMMTMGQVTNHMSVDAANVQFFFDRANELWTVPIRIALTLLLLYIQLREAAFVGASIFIFVIPSQIIIAKTYNKYMKSVMMNADHRLKTSNEMLQGMKVLKLYGWERIFSDFIKTIRVKELSHLTWVYFVAAVNFVVNSGTPIVANLLAFSTYTAITGEVLSPDVAFTALALLNALTDPMFILPFVINLFVNAHVSTKRLSFFLSGPEIESKDDDEENVSNGVNGVDKDDVLRRRKEFTKSRSPRNTDDEIPMSKSPLVRSYEEGGSYGSTSKHRAGDFIPRNVAIRVQDGNFTWDPKSTSPVLSDINVDIPSGKLTVVVGTVGSGKSSLLQAIMGEMTTIRGRVVLRKGAAIAYGPQKAWLMNASLKDNIIFGTDFDATKYSKVINACALAPDIAMLPGGDHTEIGEKGINLSGGQKQRVSVARTMYSKSDIVILDDPLSALDMHVGAHLFENGILKILKKQKRTIILVTHQLQYLPEADKIIVMKDGKILLQGDPDDIAAADPSLCADWQKAIKVMTESEAELSGAESEAVLEERRSLKKQISRLELSMSKSSKATPNDSETEKGRLIVTEDRERGSVSYKVYLAYCKAMNYCVAILMILTVLMRAALQVGTNFWLAEWSEIGVGLNKTQQEALEDTDYYISIYAALSVGNIIMRVFSVMAITCGVFFAAKHMHISMLDNIISIPMRFFDTTPTGRILNRLSTDTQYIDQRLLQTIRTIINLASQVLSSFVVIIAANYLFVSFMVPILVAFALLLVYYIITSRELQRNESVTRSPIFAHFSETLGGLPTIRAFQDEKRFFNIAIERILKNNAVFLYLVTAQRWVAIRLDYLGALAVLMSSLASVLAALNGGLDSSYVGLVISYSLEISLYMNLVVRAAADLELQMNAVERVQYYTEVPTEDYDGIEPPRSWPDKGDINLENISVRYAKDLDPVLQEVTLHIPEKEKLGICGRTGSGKSSLTLALFRIIDTFQGRIVIDGLDIATIPLITLRQRLSIIPQDAFMFTGTIRLNLDPTKSKRDDELWKALEIAQLKDVVAELDEGLDHEVTEGGDNFSVGQRQLFCLARAFLRNSRIVIMDEATASIDHETDRIIQDVVSDVFADRTVLTIAHRVGTILGSDTILTLSDGKVLEFDPPSVLLDRDDSTFASLVKAGK